MSAVKIPDASVPIARTDADWAFDIAFRDEDWTGREISVVFARQGLPALVFEASIGDGVLTPDADMAVALRIPAATWADKTPGRYSAQVRGLEGDNRDDAAVFTVTLVRGLSDLLDSPLPAGLPVGDGLVATGGVIVNRAGRVEVVRSAGVAGRGLLPWREVVGATTAVDRDRLICNSAGAAFTIMLPPDGGEVWVRDKAGSFGQHAVTLAGNGRTFDGDASLICDAAGHELRLTSVGDAWTYQLNFIYGSDA